MFIKPRNHTKEEYEKQRKELKEWIIAGAIGIVCALILKFFVIGVFAISGESMLPTFQDSDFVLAEKISYQQHGPKIGNVVIINLNKKQTPNNEEMKIIKRVVGLPGDKIEVHNGYLYRNDKKIKESYIAEKMSSNFGPVVVKSHHIFAMGDNRNKSADSRYFGQFDDKQIDGRVFLELYNNPFKTY